MTAATRIIGLDPGLRHTGWGVVDVQGSKLTFIACGAVSSTAQKTLGARLVEIEAGLMQAFDAYAPHEAAVEQTFVNRDGAATLKLGQARAMCLLVPARRDLMIGEYAPNLIKRAVTGNGHADKKQMDAMVRILLPQATPDNEHATDALAIAITHAHLRGRAALEMRAELQVRA